MANKIPFLKNNDKRDWDDTEWINEFIRFLQGDPPKGIKMPRGHAPKMSEKKAWSVVWYLQEKLPVLPDNIEQCDNCGCIFDSNTEGDYWQKKFKHYCDGCCHLIPEEG